MNYTLINDGVHNFYFNTTLQLLVDVTKVLIYGKINVNEDENDRKFQRNLVDTVIDLEKAMKGVRGNFVSAMIIEEMLKSSEGDFSFPLQKVRSIGIGTI